MFIYRNMTVMAMLALSMSFIVASNAQAQRGGFGGAFDMLRNESVRKELDITKEQQKKLTEANEASRKGMREKFSGIRDLPRDQQRDKWREVFGKIREEQQKSINKVLLPHQRDRLKQITLQVQLQQRGTTRSLSGDLAKELNITEEQQKKIAEAAAKAQKELQAKIAKLQKEARKEILSVLTSEQQAKLKKLMGESFEYKSNPRTQGGDRRNRRNRDRNRQGNNSTPDA